MSTGNRWKITIILLKATYFYSLASPMPSGFIANIASASGRHGESYILHILVSLRPRQINWKVNQFVLRVVNLPFLKYNRVVDECAIMLPPMGFLGSALNIAAPSTWATTWFVITTATPNWKSKRYVQCFSIGMCGGKYFISQSEQHSQESG